MNTEKNFRGFIFKLILAVIAVIFMIFGARACSSILRPRSGPVRVTVITPEIPVPTPGDGPTAFGPLVISYETHSLECGPKGKVISATIDLKISGGIAPYHLEFNPSSIIISDIQEGSIIRFVLEGGKTLTVTVKSNTSDGEPLESQDIRAPSSDNKCIEQSSLITDTPTLQGIYTLTKSPTDVYFPLDFTATKSQIIPETITVIVVALSSTSAVEPAPSSPQTNTPDLPTNELTPTQEPNQTQEPNPTKEPEPTKEPKPTQEPKPTKEPKPTQEPKPTKEPKSNEEPNNETNFLLFIFKFWFNECNDGVDNDTDLHIDINDNECKHWFDNHEDR